MPGVIVDLSPPYVDERGEIQMLAEFPIASALVITSNSGAVRGNHYHNTDEHYSYLASGRMEYHHRPAGSTNPPEVVTIEPGQMFYTPARTEHAMRFIEDSVFYVFSTEKRDQESYESDVVRVKIL